MSFTTSYLVEHASIVRESGILRVQPVSRYLPSGNSLIVDDDSNRSVTYRSGRRMFSTEGALRDELLLIVEIPDFDIQTLIGELLVPCTP